MKDRKMKRQSKAIFWIPIIFLPIALTSFLCKIIDHQQKRGQLKWELTSASDINGDGLVDIYDIVLAGKNCGKTKKSWP